MIMNKNVILSELKICVLMLILYPFFILFQFLLLTNGKQNFSVIGWISMVVLFSVLGIGVLKKSAKIRLVSKILLISSIFAPIVGIISAPFLNFDLFLRVLNMHDMDVVLWNPLAIFCYTFFLSILYLAINLYFLNKSKG